MLELWWIPLATLSEGCADDCRRDCHSDSTGHNRSVLHVVWALNALRERCGCQWGKVPVTRRATSRSVHELLLRTRQPLSSVRR
jgi:hypothetical protein